MRAALSTMLLIVPVLAFAQEGSQAPDEGSVPCAPTTRPTATAPAVPPELQARIDALIAQLGASAFERREAATAGLTEIGPPAREALALAAGSDDAEVAERAARLLAALEEQRTVHDGDPDVSPGQMQIVQVGGRGVVSVREISTGAMKLKMRQDAEGVHVQYETRDANGKRVTAKADVKTLAELKKKHPKLHALVEKHFGKNGQLKLQIRFGAGPGPMQPGVPPQAAPAAARLGAALARLGARGRLLDAATCGKLRIKAGVLIDAVLGATRPAARLGARRGDVITAINGRVLTGEGGVLNIARGGVRSLTVLRGGQQVQLTLPPPPEGADDVPGPPVGPIPIPPLP